MIPLALSLLLSCSGSGPDSGAKRGDTGPTHTGPPMEPLFSFVVIADPHVTSAVGDRTERLAAAIEWVNQHALDRRIELVWIVGDIGWGGGLEVVDAMLLDLEVPWVPVLGDNEVHFGDEQLFDQTFADQYAVLAGQMENWERGVVEVHDPGLAKDLWLQNFAFDYQGIRWVGLDWVSRVDGMMGEFGELNDLDGGSLPFFQGEVGGLADGPDENVLLFSHHAMHLGSFDLAELDAFTAVTGVRAERVAANYAGHYHVDYYERIEAGGYDVFVTDATWDDENTIRVVDVSGDGTRFAYEQELVLLD